MLDLNTQSREVLISVDDKLVENELHIVNQTFFLNIRYMFSSYIDSHKLKKDKLLQIEKWHDEHGVLILGYDMFRILVQDILCEEDEVSSNEKKMKEILIHPGPDLVICDEGHLLKNERTSISDILSLL